MIPLIGLAVIVWSVAIKRIVDYSRHKSSQKKRNVNASSMDAERNFYLDIGASGNLEESQKPAILIRDSKVYLVKGETDEQ